MKYRLTLAAVLFAAATFSSLAAAQSREELATKVFEANRDAVVTIHVVSKALFISPGGSSEEEMVNEATGAVIGADGLTVVSLSAADPSHLLSNMMDSMSDDYRMQVETVSLEILKPDGGEIKAEIVLRDKDLDLAFVRPQEKLDTPMPFIDLANAGEATVFEQVVTINRLGKVANRVHAGSFERINAVVEKPRKFYLPGTDSSQTTAGSPVFKLDGSLVGVFVIRSIKSSGGGGGGMFGGSNDNAMAIVLPVADILESAQQVPALEAAEN